MVITSGEVIKELAYSIYQIFLFKLKLTGNGLLLCLVISTFRED
jgi:hypothetical protein